VELGIIAPEAPDRFSAGDVRRAMLARSFEDAGIAPGAMAAAIRDLGSGTVSPLAFLDAPSYERFAAFSDQTFGRSANARGSRSRWWP
jgi:hypothetical protein